MSDSKKETALDANALVKVEATSVVDVSKCFHEASLTVPSAVLHDPKRLVAFGKGLRQIEDRVGWYVGDLAIATEREYGREKATVLLSSMGFASKTVSNYVWTVRCYTPKERDEILHKYGRDIPFGLFTELASYPQTARLRLFELRTSKRIPISASEMRAIKQQVGAEAETDDQGNTVRRLKDADAFEAIVSRLEKVDTKTGTKAEIQRKVEKAINPTVVTAQPTLAAQGANAPLPPPTVAPTATVNPPVDVDAWLNKLPEGDKANIMRAWKTFQSDYRDLMTQSSRIANCVGRVGETLGANANALRAMFKEMFATLGRSNDRAAHALDELSGFIATAVANHNAHHIDASEKVGDGKAMQTASNVAPEMTASEKRKAARVKADKAA